MIIHRIKSALILSSVSVSWKRTAEEQLAAAQRMFAYRVSLISSQISLHRKSASILISDSERSARSLSALWQTFHTFTQYLRGFRKDTDCAHLWACHRRTRSVFPTIFAPLSPFPVKVSALYSPRRKSVDLEIDRPCCHRMSGDEIPARWSMGSLGAIAPKSHDVTPRSDRQVRWDVGKRAVVER